MYDGGAAAGLEQIARAIAAPAAGTMPMDLIVTPHVKEHSPLEDCFPCAARIQFRDAARDAGNTSNVRATTLVRADSRPVTR